MVLLGEDVQAMLRDLKDQQEVHLTVLQEVATGEPGIVKTKTVSFVRYSTMI